MPAAVNLLDSPSPMHTSSRSISLVALLLASASSVRAEPKPAPLATLPADKVQALGPLLRANDLALIESNDKGAMKQLTTVTLVAAPPDRVREVVIHPERYGQFVRNMKESTVKPEPGGTLIHSYSINYTIYTVDGRHRYVFNKEGVAGGPPTVEMYDSDSNGIRHYRWEFLPSLGGTIVVLYGYANIPHDGFLSKFLDKAPTLEYGLALIPQMTLLLAMKEEAQRQQNAVGGVALPTGVPGSYEFLLERGTVALFRTQHGRLSDISLVDRVKAKPDVILKVAGEPQQWSSFLPTLKRSTPLGNQQGLTSVEIEQALPLMSWTTTWAYRADAKSVDYFAMSGDLSGGRMRVDVRPQPGGSSELVLRTNEHYDKGSIVVRQLYKLEPFFEYGIDVGLDLVLLEGVHGRAEQLDSSRANR